MRIHLEYPKDYAKRFGMNSLYSGRHWAVRSQDAGYWHGVVQAALRRQKIRKAPFPGPVRITFYWADRLDLSNEAYAAKMIEDALKGWVIVDDDKKYVRSIHHEINSGKGIVVEVRELDGKG